MVPYCWYRNPNLPCCEPAIPSLMAVFEIDLEAYLFCLSSFLWPVSGRVDTPPRLDPRVSGRRGHRRRLIGRAAAPAHNPEL